MIDDAIFCSEDDVPAIVAFSERLRNAADCAAETAGDPDRYQISEDRGKWPTHATTWIGASHGFKVVFRFEAERASAPTCWGHRKGVNHVNLCVESASPLFRGFSHRMPIADHHLDEVPSHPTISDFIEWARKASSYYSRQADIISTDPLAIHAGTPGSHEMSHSASSSAFSRWSDRRRDVATLLSQHLRSSDKAARLEITAPTPWSTAKAMLVRDQFSSQPAITLPDEVAAATSLGLPPAICLSHEDDSFPPRRTLSATRLGPAEIPETIDPVSIAKAIRSIGPEAAERISRAMQEDRP